jgi:serine protease AprX
MPGMTRSRHSHDGWDSDLKGLGSGSEGAYVTPLSRPRRCRFGLVAVLAASLALPTAATVQAAGPEVATTVIVRGAAAPATAKAVGDAGGSVDRQLSSIGAVTAEVTPTVAARLRAVGLEVTPDADVAPNSLTTSVTDAELIERQLRAANTGDRADLGKDIGVALIDTGVAGGTGAFGTRLQHGPDFSKEGEFNPSDGRPPVAHTDEHGHGTFMAGLIAGERTGSAPGAHLVSLKVAGADGGTTLSQLLAAIDWVIEYQDEYEIGVLNLSFGVEAPPAAIDPLVGAVEVAWASGLTVVASAGNDTLRVTSPGWSPWVITVGALDPATFRVPAWSGSSTLHGARKPELVAPGVSVVSVLAPGGTITPQLPLEGVGRETGYLRGSGTSMATALTAGAAAAYLAKHHEATPWAVKRALTSTTIPVTGSDAGALDLRAALAVGVDEAVTVPAPGNGASPGPFTADDPGGPWAGTRWSDLQWDGTRWSGTRWSGTRWSAAFGWDGTRWSGTRWSGTRWSGTRWSGIDWEGTRWSGTRWSGTRWSGTRWSGTRWSAVGFDATGT